MITTEEYQEYLKSEEWQEKRRDMREICDGVCMECGNRGNILHHETYERVLHEELSDLKWVCSDCHDDIHKRGEVFVPHFARRYNKIGEYTCLT